MHCSECPELCSSRSLIVMPSPAPFGGLLAIGEAPGQIEDEKGYGFAGQAGKTLDALMEIHGISRDGYGQANICRCRPPGNRRPSKNEVSACLPKLVEFIAETKPRLLLLVGGTATNYFMGAGSLLRRIEMSRRVGGDWLDASLCHAAIRPIAQSGLLAIPMPHTSGMAWHRKAPNGQTWCEIGKEQVALAVETLRS